MLHTFFSAIIYADNQLEEGEPAKQRWLNSAWIAISRRRRTMAGRRPFSSPFNSNLLLLLPPSRSSGGPPPWWWGAKEGKICGESGRRGKGNEGTSSIHSIHPSRDGAESNPTINRSLPSINTSQSKPKAPAYCSEEILLTNRSKADAPTPQDVMTASAVLCRPPFGCFPFLLYLLLWAFPVHASGHQPLLGPGDGEQLKARLLANLNKYGGPTAARDGPLEPIGAAVTQSPASLALPGLPQLLAMLGVTQPPSSTTSSPAPTANAADRRFWMLSKEKRWRKAAEMIGDWRRKMYKMFRSIRRKGRPGEGLERKPGNGVFLRGDPPAIMDQRKADKLARLFGVESRRKANGSAANLRRKHLHAREMRSEAVHQQQQQANGRGTAAASPSAEWDAYADDPPPQQLEGEEEEFEIVYVPALKRRLEGEPPHSQQHQHLAAEDAVHHQHVPAREPTQQQQQRRPPTMPAPPPAFDPPPPPSSSSPVAPIAPVPSPLPSPTVPQAMSILPLQFPTLLPPMVSFTLPPALMNPLPALTLATTTAAAPHLPERELLRELENVPEDYVDEQERRLPCLQRQQQQPSAAPSAACKRARDRPQEQAAVQTPLLDEQLPWDENREMCNSARLRALIQQSIVPSSVEKSKRVLQQRAEAHYGAFYNVICGTGFFSYIAHTDEFCLVAVHDVHCYVFSPVCASQLSFASGIARQRLAGNKRRRGLQTSQRRHFLNRN